MTPLLHQPDLIGRKAPSYMLLLGSGYSSDIKTTALDRKNLYDSGHVETPSLVMTDVCCEYLTDTTGNGEAGEFYNSPFLSR